MGKKFQLLSFKFVTTKTNFKIIFSSGGDDSTYVVMNKNLQEFEIR